MCIYACVLHICVCGHMHVHNQMCNTNTYTPARTPTHRYTDTHVHTHTHKGTDEHFSVGRGDVSEWGTSWAINRGHLQGRRTPQKVPRGHFDTHCVLRGTRFGILHRHCKQTLRTNWLTWTDLRCRTWQRPPGKRRVDSSALSCSWGVRTNTGSCCWVDRHAAPGGKTTLKVTHQSLSHLSLIHI